MKTLISKAFITVFFISLCMGADFPLNMNYNSGFWVKNQGQMPSEILYYSDTNIGRILVREDDIVIQKITNIEFSAPFERYYKRNNVRNKDWVKRRTSNTFLSFTGSEPFIIDEIKPSDTRINIFRGSTDSGWITDIITFKSISIQGISQDIDLVLDFDNAEIIWTLQINDLKGLDEINIVTDTGEELLPFIGIECRGEFIGYYDPVNNSIIKTGITGKKSDKKNDPSQMIWGTFLGGSDYDSGGLVALDSNDDVLLLGFTLSPDIPVPNGLYTSFTGEEMMYIAKLNSEGNSLLWATYLGGNNYDAPSSIIVDSMDNIIIYGETNSTDMPAPNGLYTSLTGASDLYIAKINSSGNSLIWATYLGGTGDEISSFGGNGLALDNNDNIILTGTTLSDDIPTPNGYDTVMGDDYMKMYIAKINSSGTSLMWGTYLGGEGIDYGITVDVDSVNNVIAGGFTQSGDIPVPNGFDTTFNGEYDIYIAKLNENGNSIVWGTYIGGTNYDELFGIKVDSNDDIILTGSTMSPDIPVPYGLITEFMGGYWDIYTAKLNSSGNQLIWGTYLGGYGLDFSTAIDLFPDGNIVVGGAVGSGGGVLTPNGFDTEYNGGEFDMYYAIINPAGDELLWGSFIGGAYMEIGTSVAVDSNNYIIVGGYAGEGEPDKRYDIIPTPNGYDQTFNGVTDLYAAKLKPFNDGPDASIIPEDMGFSPSNPVPGDTIILTARVYNLGDEEIISGYCSFYYSLEPYINLVFIDTQAMGGIAPSDYQDLSVNWITGAEMDPAIYLITAILTDIFPEDTNPDNNAAFIEVPLPVELAYFEALGISSRVNISWLTLSETDNLGFNLYRLNAEKITSFVSYSPIKLNDSLIPGHGTSSEPHRYTFTDRVKSQGDYFYILESVSVNGETMTYKTRLRWVL